MKNHDIIIRPILSEKSYAGIADKKSEIKLAIEQIFGVKVESVNTANVDGKWKRMGMHQGLTPSYKKAIVQLKKDSKSIEFFDSLS